MLVGHVSKEDLIKSKHNVQVVLHPNVPAENNDLSVNGQQPCMLSCRFRWCPDPGFGPVPPDAKGAPRPGSVGTRGGFVSTGPGSAGARAVAETAERIHLRFVFHVHAADQTPADESSQDRCAAIQTKLFCMSLARLARTWFQCTSLARPGMKPITPKTYQTGQAEEGRERRQRLGYREYAMAHPT
jgi:hypothetical protein